MAKTEVEDTKPPLSKRMITYVIDLGIIGMMAVIIFAVANIITKNSSGYKALDNQITEIKNDSGLYIDGVDIISYTKNESHFTSYETRKNYLSSHIDSFYVNTNFFTSEKSTKTISEYNKRKLEAKSGETPLFVYHEGVISENAVEPEKLYNFYSTEINDNSYSFLLYNNNYSSLMKASFWIVVAEIVISSTIMYSIVYLLFPLVIFKRGRQTPGMKLMKIGLISYHAVNVSSGVYVGRFFFCLIICFYLNFIAFLIPAIVSISMTFLGKTSPSLPNYIFNDYFVDIKNQDIYLDEVERRMSSESVNKSSIENKDFVIKQ